jgi:hypothetical protein
MHGRVAQGLEQATHNRSVVGSNPTPPISRTQSGRGRRAPHRIGAASEPEVFVALQRAGYTVLAAPFASQRRYDCVIDDGERLRRVQIETGYVGCDAVRFASRSTAGSGPNRSRSYHGAADLFAVWVPELQRCCLAPVRECGRRDATLRLSPARNGRLAGARRAVDFELCEMRAPSPSTTPSTRLSFGPSPTA